MSAQTEHDPPPSRLPWPPILIAAAIVCGLFLDKVSADAFHALVSFPGATLLGGAMVALALANDVWCARVLARLETTILPHRAATHLATDGPYQWSRNPIYVSHVAIVLGIGLLVASPFTILLTPLLAFSLQKLSIEPEERHLSGKFGEEYRAYMARARRWL